MQKTVNIANGASLSGVVDFGMSARLRAIQMPAAWTAAGLTFQGSEDGITFYNLFTPTAELAIAAAATGTGSQIVTFTWDMIAAFVRLRYIKVRSGTAGSPVNQGASRDLILLADDIRS